MGDLPLPSSRFLIIAATAALFAGQASAQIYRCESADSVIFSDRPCAEGANEYHSTGSVSVVEPAEDLRDIGERNREFIRDRRERQAARRRAMTEQPREPLSLRPTEAQEVTRILYVPESHRPERRERIRRESGEQPPQSAPQSDERPFSALRGPFPGTRREERERRETPPDQ